MGRERIKERNEKMIKRYKEGASIYSISIEFGIKKIAYIREILGIRKKREHKQKKRSKFFSWEELKDNYMVNYNGGKWG